MRVTMPIGDATGNSCATDHTLYYKHKNKRRQIQKVLNLQKSPCIVKEGKSAG